MWRVLLLLQVLLYSLAGPYRYCLQAITLNSTFRIHTQSRLLSRPPLSRGRDGVMDPAGSKPCAAVPGTTIVVEDLFYNSTTRKKVSSSRSTCSIL